MRFFNSIMEIKIRNKKIRRYILNFLSPKAGPRRRQAVSLSIFEPYSPNVVGYTISQRAALSAVTEISGEAFRQIPNDSHLILYSGDSGDSDHSDRGRRYRHKRHQQMLPYKGIRRNMNRKATCPGNAVMKNFRGHPESGPLYLQPFGSIGHCNAEPIVYSNSRSNRRITAKFKGLPPALHRLQALPAASLFLSLTFWGRFISRLSARFRPLALPSGSRPGPPRKGKQSRQWTMLRAR